MADDLEIYEELELLLPALDQEATEGLESELRRNGGPHDPLWLWNNVLVDGHNRYAICRQFDLPFKTIQVWDDLHTLDDVKARIKLNAASQRNLTPHQCSKLRYEAVQHLLVHKDSARAAAQEVAAESGLSLRQVQRDISKGEAVLGVAEELQDSEVVWGMSEESVGKLAMLEPVEQQHVLEQAGHNAKRATTALKQMSNVKGNVLYNEEQNKKRRKLSAARIRENERALLLTAREKLARTVKAIKEAQKGLGLKEGCWHKALHHLDEIDLVLNDWTNMIQEKHRVAAHTKPTKDPV